MVVFSPFMEKTFQIVDANTDSVCIKIVVTACDDGSLRIDDWSMGAAADLIYGEGSDVERWITVSPDSTRKLSVKLFRDWIDDPAADVGNYLAIRYLGDTRALSHIEELLKSFDVPYERMSWA